MQGSVSGGLILYMCLSRQQSRVRMSTRDKLIVEYRRVKQVRETQFRTERDMVGQGTIKSSSSIIVSKLVGSPYPFYVLHDWPFNAYVGKPSMLACWHKTTVHT